MKFTYKEIKESLSELGMFELLRLDVDINDEVNVRINKMHELKKELIHEKENNYQN